MANTEALKDALRTKVLCDAMSFLFASDCNSGCMAEDLRCGLEQYINPDVAEHFDFLAHKKGLKNDFSQHGFSQRYFSQRDFSQRYFWKEN